MRPGPVGRVLQRIPGSHVDVDHPAVRAFDHRPDLVDRLDRGQVQLAHGLVVGHSSQREAVPAHPGRHVSAVELLRGVRAKKLGRVDLAAQHVAHAGGRGDLIERSLDSLERPGLGIEGPRIGQIDDTPSHVSSAVRQFPDLRCVVLPVPDQGQIGEVLPDLREADPDLVMRRVGHHERPDPGGAVHG